MSDLISALDLLDLAVASSEGLASEEHRRSAAAIASAARRRRDYLGSTVLIAIAGGTGSGKSSLLNALAHESVAPTSTIRPYTDEPAAWIPSGDPSVAAFVAELGIGSVVEHDDDSDLAIVDLPDLDSVDGRHRELAEHLIPLVDAVVWVFDPVKYHDPSIHRDFLSCMVPYHDVFVFVLNKTDRLDEAETEAVLAHLSGILELDGFDDPIVVPVAANSPGGEPQGIEDLTDVIAQRLVAARADRAKLVEDLLTAGRVLAADANLWNGTPDDAYDRLRVAADDPDRLADVIEDLGIEGPMKDSLLACDGRSEQIDAVLLGRSRLAATVAALGVACASLMPGERRHRS